MTKIDPKIAVNAMEASSKWNQQIFGFKSINGGNEFAVLVSGNDEIVLCLHKWENMNIQE